MSWNPSVRWKRLLLDGRELFPSVVCLPGLGPVATPPPAPDCDVGFRLGTSRSLPAPGADAYVFLRDTVGVASSRVDTIAPLIEWSRGNRLHFQGSEPRSPAHRPVGNLLPAAPPRGALRRPGGRARQRRGRRVRTPAARRHARRARRAELLGGHRREDRRRRRLPERASVTHLRPSRCFFAPPDPVSSSSVKRSRKKLTSGDGWSFVASCRDCGRPQTECVCRADQSAGGRAAGGRGPIVRLRLEKRRGKPVTVADGADWPAGTLRALLKELKSVFATGGTLKGREIELQGDHRERLRELLASRGVRVKG